MTPETTLKPCPLLTAELENDIVNAIWDLQSGLKYIRMTYGELNGVGFDRAIDGGDAVIKKMQALTPAAPETTS